MSAWTLYLITRLDTLVGISTTAAIIGGVAVLISVPATMFGRDTIKDGERLDSKSLMAEGSMLMATARRVRTWAIVAVVLGVLGITFLPTTKQAAVIYVLPKVANNEQLQTEAGELYGLAKEYLKRQVEEPEKR